MTVVYLWVALLGAPAHAAPPIPELPQLEQVFDALDASPAQRRALREVAAAAMKDAATEGARREVLQLVEEAVGALMSEEVDRGALEASRRGAVDLLERTSSALIPHVADAAEILTIEQRASIRDRLWAAADRWLGTGKDA